MRENFEIGEVSVAPGTRTTVNIPLSRLADHTPAHMQAHVIHGKKDGPVMFVSAAIHGDEIIGVEIIRRITGLKKLSKLQGTLILIPVVNTYGFIGMSRYLPDRRDLNRCFPGSESGSMASQLAHVFMTEIVARAEYGIDLHSGAIHRGNFPQIRAHLVVEKVEKMARSFGAPIMLNSSLRDGSLREAAQENGCAMLLYEAGEALRFDETSVRIGVKGVLGVMRDIHMLPPTKSEKKQPVSVRSDSSHWLRAPMGGILRTRKKLGDSVKEGEEIGFLADPLGFTEEAVLARSSGIIIGMTHLPIINRGDALFHVAVVKSVTDATTTMDQHEEAVEDNALYDDANYQ